MQPPADDLYDEMMALIERTRALNEKRKPRAIAAKAPPAPVVAAAELTGADFDETDRIIARERAVNAHLDRRKARARTAKEPAPEVKTDEPEEDEKGGDLQYVNGEVAYQWSAWDWEIGAGAFSRYRPAFFKAIRGQTVQCLDDDLAAILNRNARLVVHPQACDLMPGIDPLALQPPAGSAGPGTVSGGPDAGS